MKKTDCKNSRLRLLPKVIRYLLFFCLTISNVYSENLEDLKKNFFDASPENKSMTALEISKKYEHFNMDRALVFSDSAMKYAELCPSQKDKIKTYIHHSRMLMFNSKVALSKKHFEKALVMADEIGDLKSKADVYLRYASTAVYQSDMKVVFERYYKAYELYIKVGDIKGQVNVCQGLANMYIQNEEYHKALELARTAEALISDDEYQSKKNELYILTGLIHKRTGNEEKALYYYNKVSDTTYPGYKVNKINACRYTSAVYAERDDYDKALEYAMIALETSRDIEDSRHIGDLLTIVSHIYFLKGDFDKDVLYNQKALAIRLQHHQSFHIASSYTNLGSAYMNTKQFQKADSAFNKGLVIAKENNTDWLIRNLYYKLYLLAKVRNNNAEALSYIEEYYRMKELIIKKSNSNKIMAVEEKFERFVDKQKLEIVAKDHELYTTYIIFLLLILLLMLIFSIFIIKSKKRLNTTLETQLKHDSDQIAKMNNEIEDRISVESELEVAKEDLHKALQGERELSELRSSIIRRMSHEFRTPMTVTLSSSQLLKQYFVLNDKVKFDKHISRIHSSVDTLINILDDVLTVNKNEQGEAELNPEKIDLVSFFKETIIDINSLKNVDDRVEIISSVSNAEALTDSKCVSKIISCLMSNSLKFSDKNSKIQMCLDSDETSFTISAVDTGCGIPERELESVFEKFFRGSNIGEKPGVGLGLSVARLIAKDLGGKIELESIEGSGTTARAILPCKFALTSDSKGD